MNRTKIAYLVRTGLVVLGLSGCVTERLNPECTSILDCPTESVCRMGSCAPIARELSAPAAVGLDDRSRPSRFAGPCAEAAAPIAGDVIFNEILNHVPGGASGDANGDGVRDPFDDEFVEIVNPTKQALDLTGAKLFGDGKLRFRFEDFCLPSHHAVVVFGGGIANLAPEVAALISDSRLSLTNSGGEILLVTSDEGTILATASYAASDGTSWTRTPDVSGEHFRPHDKESTSLFSPGTCANGRPFSEGCSTPDEEVEPRPGPDLDAGGDDGDGLDIADAGDD
jgi:hypothetical protein